MDFKQRFGIKCPIKYLEKIEGSKTPIHLLYRENDPKAEGYDPPLKNTHFIEGKSHPIHLENPSGYKKALLSIYPDFLGCKAANFV